MKTRFKQIILALLLMTGVAYTALAAEPFDPLLANQMLDKLTIQLSITQPTAESLESAANKLSIQSSKAEDCVADTQQELQEISLVLPEVSDPAALSKDQRYLYDKKIALGKRLSECRFFILRADEAITAFKDSAQALTTSAIFEKGPHIWAQFKTTPAQFKKAIANFNLNKIKEQLGLNLLGPEHYMPLLVLLMIGLMLTTWIRRSTTTALNELKVSSLPEEVLQNLLAIIRSHAFAIPPLFIITTYFTILSLIDQQFPTLVTFCYVLIGYLVSVGLVEFFFYPPKPAKAYCQITESYAKKFTFLLKLLAHVLLIGLMLLFFLADQAFPEVIFYLIRDIFYTGLTINVFAILFVLNRMPKFLGDYKKTRSLFSVIIMLFLIAILIAEWTGYQRFSSYLLEGVALTVLATFVAVILNDVILTFLSSFSEHKYLWQVKFHDHIGVKKDDSLPEMVGLKAGMFLFVWGAYIIALTNIWTVSSFWARHIWDTLTQTISIPNTDFSIIPSRIILGFIVFSFGVLLTRYLRALIQQKVASSKDRAEREAYGAIFGYTGFAMSLIFALVVGGVDLKGLALIAGALSLGIGFGLQNIVSNFVSGIILLLERPIKPGDRIAIGEDEGFVKSVNIRSTCITTLENLDIIVPNADLISTQVINQTFNNYHWRVTVLVGVAYGSDIKLVEECLYKVAHEHPEVIQDGPDKPKVFFLEFGDSSLNFEMWCTIRNVNLKLFVLSELNFAVDKIFAENNIEIPFPQSDIHIRDTVSIPLKQIKGDNGHES